MNYLAHILLAGPTAEAQLGGLLGDFTKSSSVATFGAVMDREIRIHRAIDSFTDSHPVVLAAKAQFSAGTRRYAGILLDVFYDHALAQRWANFCDIGLSAYLAKFYAGIADFRHLYPEKFAQVAPKLIAENWLASYQRFEGVETAVRRMSMRLSRGAEAMQAGLADLGQHYEEFCEGFNAFFPELIKHADAHRARLMESEPSD